MQTPFTLSNRHGLNIAGLVELPATTARGTAVLVHGLGGQKEAPMLTALAHTFTTNGYTAVRYDASHGFGTSGGSIEQLTPTTHADDLEDIITYIQTQPWFKAPLVLCGHSLGSFACLRFATRKPQDVAALIPISAAIGGRKWHESYQTNNPDFFFAWQRDGFFVKKSYDKAKEGKVLWAYAQDAMTYDLLADTAKITCPTLLCVGADDDTTPPMHQILLLNSLGSTHKELHIIPHCGHTPRSKEQVQTICDYVEIFLKRRM